MTSIVLNDYKTTILDSSDIIERYKGLPITELTMEHFKYPDGMRMMHTATNVMYISENGEIKLLKARRPVYHEDSIVVLPTI